MLLSLQGQGKTNAEIFLLKIKKYFLANCHFPYCLKSRTELNPMSYFPLFVHISWTHWFSNSKVYANNILNICTLGIEDKTIKIIQKRKKVMSQAIVQYPMECVDSFISYNSWIRVSCLLLTDHVTFPLLPLLLLLVNIHFLFPSDALNCI